jgi:hypothetical protein
VKNKTEILENALKFPLISLSTVHIKLFSSVFFLPVLLQKSASLRACTVPRMSGLVWMFIFKQWRICDTFLTEPCLYLQCESGHKNKLLSTNECCHGVCSRQLSSTQNVRETLDPIPDHSLPLMGIFAIPYIRHTTLEKSHLDEWSAQSTDF